MHLRRNWIRSRRIDHGGFTLIEVLVVVAIIALLIAILIPSLARARGQARRTACMANMHQIYLALMMYKDSNQDRIPDWVAVGKWFFRRAPGMTDGKPGSLKESFGLSALLAGVGPVEQNNTAARKKYLSAYSEVWRCPASPGWMWEKWKNTYANLKLTMNTPTETGNIPTNCYTKLMMRIKITDRASGKITAWDPSKIPVLQDNYTWLPGNCGWMGADSWSKSAGYALTNVPPPHAYKGRTAKTDGSSSWVDPICILWLDGNAGKGGGGKGL